MSQINLIKNYKAYFKSIKLENLWYVKDMHPDSSGYQLSAPYYFEAFVNLINEIYGIEWKHLTFADYGCGTGYFFNFLNSQGVFKECKGYEYSKILIEKSPFNNIIHKDITEINNHKADIIYTYQITFNEKDKYFRKLLSNLKEGQCFIEICDDYHTIKNLAIELNLEFYEYNKSIIVYKYK